MNIVSSLGTAVLSALLLAIAYPVYLHYLGYEQYGLWLVLSTVLVMAQLGNLGISPALLKLVAEDFADGNVQGVYQYLLCGLCMLLATGMILVAGVLLFRNPLIAVFGITGAHGRLAYDILPYIAVLSVYLLIADALTSVVAGLGRYDLVSYTQLAGQLLTVAVALVLLRARCGLWGLLIANAVSSIFLNIMSLLLIRRITRSQRWIWPAWDTRRLCRIWHFGSWVFGGSLVNMAINPLNKLLITRFAGIAAVPVYDLSFATCMKLRSLFESGFRSLAAEFSSLNAVRPGDARRSLASADRRGMKAVLYWGTLVYLLVFLACGRGLQVWLGARFTPELPAIFRIMLVGTYIGLWGVQPWYSLLGFGRSRHILLTNVVTAACNVAFVLLWPLILHRPATLITITVGTSVGMLGATVCLRWRGARLRADLAHQSPAPAAFRKDLAVT